MIRKRLARRNNQLVGYLFLLPPMSVFIFFVCLPVIQTFTYSLTKWAGIGPKVFVGFKNYIDIIFNDETFFIAIRNNLLWTVGSAAVPVWIGLILANLLVRSGIKHHNIFQLIFFLPQVVSTVIATTMWKWLYNPVLGPLKVLLPLIGIEKYNGLLGNPKTVMIALFIIYVWQTYGFCMVIFSSAIQCVDTQLYDAAKIDGCGWYRQFWAVTMPGIRQAMTSTLLLMVIWSFQIFDLVMTTTRGGPGYSSYVISYYVYYEGFIANKIGYSAAASIMLATFIMIFSKVFMYFREKQ